MLSFVEIEKQYPEYLRKFRRNILREYLQYKILGIIFDSGFAGKLSFLGGTALRIVHDNTRFSEDLDFDNFSLTQEEFEKLAEEVRKKLSLEGYLVETKNIFKNAYRCSIRIPRLLFESGLSGYEEEKILIQLDTLAHGFSYTPDRKLLNKFDVFTEINATPADIILSQKIYAIFNRKAQKGRDFFDAVFLLSKVKPNYEYLFLKMGIKNSVELKEQLLRFCEAVDFDVLAKDVESFLFFSKDTKKIELFSKVIQDANL